MPRFTTFDGIELHYEEEGDGPPVVLLHGFTSSIDGNWRQPGIWKAVLDTGKRVIGLDARGHGRSDKPHDPAAYADGAMARDVAAVFDHLGLVAPGGTDLVGYSMGAATAVRVAAGGGATGGPAGGAPGGPAGGATGGPAGGRPAGGGPVADRLRRLVLGGIGGDPAKWGDPERARARADVAARMVAGLEAADPATITDPVARRARRLMEARGNDLQAMIAIQRAAQPLAGDIDLGRITVPTLVVCGDKDASPEKLAAALPHGQARVLSGDHEGVVVNPALAAAIAAFLE